MTETNSTLPGSIQIVNDLAHVRQRILDQTCAPEVAPRATPKFSSWGMQRAAFKTKEDELQEWVRIAKKLEARTGCKVLGFDPNFSLTGDNGNISTTIPFGLALVIIGEHPDIRGTLANMAVRRQPRCLKAACNGLREVAYVAGGRHTTDQRNRRSSRSFSSLTRGPESAPSTSTNTDNSETESTPLTAAAVDIIAGRLGGMLGRARSRRASDSDVSPGSASPSEGA